MMRTPRYITVLLVVAVAVAMAPVGSAHASGSLSDVSRTGDWRSEKHVPLIECPAEFKAGEPTTVTVTVGKEIGHPNTALHHIRWIRLYFVPADATLAYEVASFEFSAHGESIVGADSSTLYTDPKISVDFRTGVSGVFYATAFCNIHGLWENMKAITVVE